MIASFGEDRSLADQRFPRSGRCCGTPASAWVCASLHTHPAPDDLGSYAFYLPDAFASEPVAHPPELVAFHLRPPAAAVPPAVQHVLHQPCRIRHA